MDTAPRTRGNKVVPLLVATVLWTAVVGLWWQRQAILDWWRLRSYTPSSEVASLAQTTAMSGYGKRLFYVNHPRIEASEAFLAQCDFGKEKTVVLGCYRGGDNGIYLYQVTDTRLKGVVETTAAHEMLHAGYARLGAAEKNRIDTLLRHYYEQELKDERIKNTVKQYETFEPADIPNEMHSIFATEVASLPAELETYYSKYFTDRQKVVALTQQYEQEFTSRRDKAAAYDAQLETMSATIDTNKNTLETLRSELDSQYSAVSSARYSGDTASYNARVTTYNTSVERYNALLETTRGLIDDYNRIVELRNGLALEERSLVKALTASPVTE